METLEYKAMRVRGMGCITFFLKNTATIWNILETSNLYIFTVYLSILMA
jgi:hypothetical protein